MSTTVGQSSGKKKIQLGCVKILLYSTGENPCGQGVAPPAYSEEKVPDGPSPSCPVAPGVAPVLSYGPQYQQSVQYVVSLLSYIASAVIRVPSRGHNSLVADSHGHKYRQYNVFTILMEVKGFIVLLADPFAG